MTGVPRRLPVSPSAVPFPATRRHPWPSRLPIGPRAPSRSGGGPFDAFDIPTVPVAVTVFPAEIYRAPRSWGERAFGNLIYWNEVDEGGHFAAWEQPQLFATEVRAAFRSLRTGGSS
jgi:pimeloyl-ACP methyl ester carboxylesterase